MCGFTGIWNFNGEPVNIAHLVAMNTTIRHRGPDDEGYLLVNTTESRTSNCFGEDTIAEIKVKSRNIFKSKPANLGIGFRRLSILDLTAAGHQPMSDQTGRFWIVLNGEIYNYIEIRKELQQAGYSFRSQSDTEVVLTAYMHWGKECLVRFNGMWAFAICDTQANTLFCARDRFGIKPFYYCYEPGKRFVFASEIKAILHVVEPVANRQSMLELFTTSNMDHSSHTFFKDIVQLPPSHYLELSDGKIAVSRYYRINVKQTQLDFDSAREQFLYILKDAVKIRMRSDVPLGFALSGGVDSSSIIALARDIYPSYDINAFSLVFPGKSMDESFYIRKVISKLGIKQKSISPLADEFLNDLDQFIWHQEEPNNGSSYWGEYRLRELIKRSGVTVSLEGQGADEIITGYPYFIDSHMFDLLDHCKIVTFFKEADAFRSLNAKSSPEYLMAYLRAVIRRPQKNQLNHLASYMNREFFSNCSGLNETQPASFRKSRLNKMLYHALTVSSVPAQLIKADKSAMAFSVECRFPFLDYRLVELAFSLPGNFKLRGGVTKYILRESLKGLIPDEVYIRKDKIGFALPQSEWLNTALKPWAREIINSSAFAQIPFFNCNILRKDFENNRNAIPDYRWWSILMCYTWIQKFNVSLK